MFKDSPLTRRIQGRHRLRLSNSRPTTRHLQPIRHSLFHRSPQPQQPQRKASTLTKAKLRQLLHQTQTNGQYRTILQQGRQSSRQTITRRPVRHRRHRRLTVLQHQGTAQLTPQRYQSHTPSLHLHQYRNRRPTKPATSHTRRQFNELITQLKPQLRRYTLLL